VGPHTISIDNQPATLY